MSRELTETIKRVQGALGLSADGIAGPKTWAAIARKIGQDLPDSKETNPAPSVDARSEKNIATLLPEAQRAARAFLRAVNDTLRAKFSSEVTVRIISGTRSYAEQDALYAKGRTEPGPMVTKARGGYSNHNFGIAFDIGVFHANGRYLEEHPAYDVAGALGKAFGLSWGGNWTAFQDKPHFELRPDWARELSDYDMMAELRRRTTRGEAIA